MSTIQPVTNPPEWVDQVLVAAMARGASDIYWLPGAEECAVRFQVNGHAQAFATVPRAFGEQCVARLKVLAGMLTYRSSVAQDGVIRQHPAAPNVEIRVASLPTLHGERLTLRLLDAGRVPRTLDSLGFAPAVHTTISEILAQQSGLFILTGPTGCGKTTTIYALLRELLRQGHDPAGIITIEDPVEGELPGVSQVSLSRAGEDWGYAQALRAALRQDVKTLVIGEIRDREVAKVVLDAALTGHRILTTYHAGDIAGVYARLLHQGFEPFLVGAAVTGVLTQRLVSRKDGGGPIPVAAVLKADDAWREFVVTHPALGALRQQLRERPGADLTAAAAALATQGVILEKDVYLL